MHGNVYEWNWDWYAAYLGNATDPSGPASGGTRLRRGGGWNNEASATRSALRTSSLPDGRDSNVGFRLVLSQGQ